MLSRLKSQDSKIPRGDAFLSKWKTYKLPSPSSWQEYGQHLREQRDEDRSESMTRSLHRCVDFFHPYTWAAEILMQIEEEKIQAPGLSDSIFQTMSKLVFISEAEPSFKIDAI